MKILIRDVPDEVCERLDKIAAEGNYSSRNQLVVEVLQRYSTVKEQVFVDALTPVVRTIITNEMKNISEQSRLVMISTEHLLKKLLVAAQKIDTYMTEDFINDDEI